MLVEVLGLKKNDVVVDGEPSGRILNHEFDVSPEEFLLQAEPDFEAGGNSRRLNSLTNSKPAIEAQVDRLIFGVGYDPKTIVVKRKWELLKEIGFITPYEVGELLIGPEAPIYKDLLRLAVAVDREIEENANWLSANSLIRCARPG